MTKGCIGTSFWICAPPKTLSGTPNEGMYFENKAFGFHNEAKWLMIDNTITMLSVDFNKTKLLRFLRYLHFNIFSGNCLIFQELILIFTNTNLLNNRHLKVMSRDLGE